MTAAAFQMTFDALPKKAQSEVMDFTEYLAHKYSLMAAKRKFSKKRLNPSPSNDPWFDDPKNMAVVREAMRENTNPNRKLYPMKDGETLDDFLNRTEQEMKMSAKFAREYA